MKKVTYNCKENDAVIKIFIADGIIDQLWIKIKGETSYTVIAYKDLQNALKKADMELIRNKGYKVCPQCTRHFVITEAKNKLFCCTACEYGY